MGYVLAKKRGPPRSCKCNKRWGDTCARGGVAVPCYALADGGARAREAPHWRTSTLPLATDDPPNIAALPATPWPDLDLVHGAEKSSRARGAAA